jgi:hypothetical protein
MVGEGINRLREGPLSLHRPDGESRRVPDDRMLYKRTALMRFAPFSTTKFSAFQCGCTQSAVTPRSWVSHKDPTYDDEA